MKKLAFAITSAVALAVAATAAGASRPTLPAIAGPNQATPGKHSYVFSSTEKGVAASKLRFRCGLDTTRLKSCARRTTLTLAEGNHVLRAQAVDPAGHRSAVARLHISVQAVAPSIAVTTDWQKAVTAKSISGALFGAALGPDGNLYVADAADDQVQVYSTSGSLLRAWGSPGSGPGQFQFEKNPDLQDAKIPFSAIGVDPSNGTVFVAEPQRIQRFDAQGNYQLGWSEVGIDPGEFSRITDVQVGASGTVYVLEDRPSTLGRVQEFDANGTFVTTFGRGQIVDSGGLVLDSQGDVLVADDKADSIKVFGPDGRLLRKIGQTGSAPGQLDFPTEMALSGNALYVADTDHSRIVRFDLATGRPTGYWATQGAARPVSLALDAAGSALYVVNELGTLTKYRLP